MQADKIFPVRLLLNRDNLHLGPWHYPQWSVISVLPDDSVEELSHPRCHEVHSHRNNQKYLWSGLYLELFRDELNAYYQNLTGAHPSLFILCDETDNTPGLMPVCITANHGDAEAHMESDGTVLATPLEAPYLGWLADFILKNQSLFESQLNEMQHEKKGKHRGA